MKKIASKNNVVALVTILFAAISFVGILYHEIWMDEAHHWLLARDSENLIDLWKNTRYEGHPMLWNLILFVITRFTNDPLWMQVAHWMIAVAVVFFFMRFSPLPLSWNILFSFGYFTLYEYAVISRNYSLITLAFLFCIYFYTNRQYIAWGLSLLLLANTHLFGLVLATWFVIATIQDFKKESLLQNSSFKTALLIFILGAILSAVQIFPPQDSPFRPQASALLSIISIEKLLAVQVRGFLPVPDFSNYNVWNSNFLTGISKPLAGVLSLVIGFLLFGVMVQKKKTIILFTGFFLSVTLIIILLYPASVVQATRHFGVVYIAFVGCLWLGFYDHSQKFPIKFSHAFTNVFITGLLLVQLLAGICILCFDIKRPFSEAKNVVAFLTKNGLSKEHVVTFHGPIPTISCYLQKKTYSLPAGRLESFYKWQEPTKVNKIDSTALMAAKKFANQYHGCILISHGPISVKMAGIVFLKEFNQAIIKVENFYIYKVIPFDTD